ncbi:MULTISPECIES: SCO family protein [Lysobacter]|jgi:protein SCO1/2|uniref:SCO family protein n=1 Tax=Lysobacter gummosus TaxID=262324 RepID=A0ABY3XIV7_9GAMM|nr:MULTISPECIES: SCO family protein [Lysobacter]ALN91147.1 SCO1/SenC family protein [Lysobacter gummosus]UJB21765.1 SCO family protein [Lysobacter capsici]UJQ29118.1 SCO family protein [Lysobacter gummosus]UNP31565.1 SCO family protein [Lysobacter gummosus]
MFNRTTAIVLIAALAAALGLWASQKYFGQARRSNLPQTEAVRLFDPPRTLPAYSLRQSDGTQLIPGELKGHWTLVFLGFTHCPDVCPTTLAQMSVAQKSWESIAEASRPRVLFVSVDPERDTPDKIGEYAHGFHKDTLAATADVPALEAFAKSLSMVFAKVPAPDGAPADQYTMDHSASMAVLDPQGRMAGLLRPPFDPNVIAKDMKALTEAAP